MHRTGLRIQRMPSEAGQEFGDPATYPYMTVASPSCHDTSTTRAWWEEDAGRRERFYYQARICDCLIACSPITRPLIGCRRAHVWLCCFVVLSSALQCSAVHRRLILIYI